MLFIQKILDFIESEVGLQNFKAPGVFIDEIFPNAFEETRKEILENLKLEPHVFNYEKTITLIEPKFEAELFKDFYTNYNRFEDENLFLETLTKLGGKILFEYPELYKTITKKIESESKSELIKTENIKDLKNIKDFYIFNMI